MRRELAREYKVMMKNITAIKKIPKEKRTFENTFAAMEHAQSRFADTLNYVTFLMYVSTDRKVRDAAQKLTETYTPKLTDIMYDIDLYHAVLACSRDKNLAPHENLLFDDTLLAYKREGLHLPRGKRKKLQSIAGKIMVLGNMFEANINKTSLSITLASDETTGLPESFLGRLKKDIKGNYVVSIQYPELGPFMQYSAIREKRRELFILSKQKGGKKNLDILKQLRTLRHQKAKLLGYNNHVDYQVEEMLAKTSSRVSDFLGDLSKKLTPYLKQDLAPLRAEFVKDHGSDAKMQPWDISYYAERVQKKFFALDLEKIREYFPLDFVMQKMLERFSDLFGISFKHISETNLWHPDVVRYDVYDIASNQLLGIITLDLFPREGKFSHGAMFDVTPGYKVSGSEKYVLPFAGIITNMTAPTATKPSLFSGNEVRTLYHEMGHALHFILGAQEFRSQSGTAVSRDFVELPSQLAEYWFSDEKLFTESSRHYQTGKRLPKDMVAMIKNQRGFLEGYSKLSQLAQSIFDIRMHDGSKGESCAVYNELFHALTGMHMPKNTYFPAGFGHLHDYDAQYWSYLWSEMLVAEAVEVFKKKGMMNKTLGMKYRKDILEPGGSMKEGMMVQKFFGRMPTSRALLSKIERDIKETQKFMREKNKYRE